MTNTWNKLDIYWYLRSLIPFGIVTTQQALGKVNFAHTENFSIENFHSWEILIGKISYDSKEEYSSILLVQDKRNAIDSRT